ncbi:MAG: DUF1566 domain-containing protein, partial [Heliobacteriaceae bacterium]|nr:DUF1566 domain-containing protein [Heliobacteriaceae bacterium]
TTTETFVDELKKYLKISQVCPSDPSGCFAPVITNSDSSKTVEVKDLKNSNDLNAGNWNTEALGIGLINGYTAILSYNPDCPALDIGAAGAQTTSCLSLVYDINGKSKPNRLGKDVYTLNANLFCIKTGSLCVSASNESYSPIDTCDGTSEYDKNCTTSNSCSYCATNRWAGAKKACADIGMRLPTKDELNTLVPHADELGMSGYFWSSTESSTSNVWEQYFPSGVQHNQNRKNDTDPLRCVR